MDFEQELERVAQQYREEGYAVITHPDKDHLSGMAELVGVDLLATRSGKKVVIQVKQDRNDVAADQSVARNADIVNGHPGWRFDLVVLREGDPIKRITHGAREPTNDEIDAELGEVDVLLEHGMNRAAIVIAWATLEAALRQVARDVERYMPKTTPTELLRTLYGNGLLTRDEFGLLRDSFRLRSEVVHGLHSPAIDASAVNAVTAIVRRLLTGKPDAKSVAG